MIFMCNNGDLDKENVALKLMYSGDYVLYCQLHYNMNTTDPHTRMYVYMHIIKF